MSIGVIIATHGLSSVELLKSAEMIVGKQSNVETITFEEGEGLEDINKSYSNAIDNLEENTNILILVDIWGGTPFNIATEQNCEVITGVNIPMLIELFMNRDTQDKNELVDQLLESTKNSIKKLSEIETELEEDEGF